MGGGEAESPHGKGDAMAGKNIFDLGESKGKYGRRIDKLGSIAWQDREDPVSAEDARRAEEINALSTMCSINLANAGGHGRIMMYDGKPVREVLIDRLRWANEYCKAMGEGTPFDWYLADDGNLDIALGELRNEDE